MPPAAQALCDGEGPIEAERLGRTVLPPGLCDLRARTLRDHGVGVKVPPPGQGVGAASVSGGRGEGQELVVETGADGTVTLRHVGREAE